MTGSPHLVLGLLWQIVKAGIMQSLNLKATPELIQLLSLEEGGGRVLGPWLNGAREVCCGPTEPARPATTRDGVHSVRGLGVD